MPNIRAEIVSGLLLMLASEVAAQPCTGDCNGDGTVVTHEVVVGVNLALGILALTECRSFDRDDSGMVDVDELIAAVDLAGRGCSPSPTPTHTVSATPTATPTLTVSPSASATPTATSTPVPNTPTASPTFVVEDVPGLTLVDAVDVPNGPGGTPHVFDLVVGDRLYLANSFGAAVAYDLGEDGLSFLYSAEPSFPILLRCTSLALHAASRRLYCAAVDVSGVALLDADTGELIGPSNLDLGGGFERGYRDLHVVGDTLYLAAFDAGLLRAAIGADGSLGKIEPFLEGEVVGVDGNLERLVVLDRAAGLRIIEGGSEVRTIPLDGPPMRLSVRDGVAAVALGSRGAVVIDVATGVTLAEAHPQCVAVDADYRDGALAIACTTGLYLYQTEPEVRTAGWMPAVYASLGVRFVGDFLIATDWRIVTRYRLNVAGRAIGLDAPRGFLLEQGQGIRFAVRNPDDREQRLNGRVLPPHGELMIEVPPRDGNEVIVLATDEQRESGPVGVQIARGKPPAAFGSIFPIPLTSRYVSFIQPDCALQFPALEDLLWLASHGEPPGGLQPLVLLVPSSEGDPWSTGGFLQLWGEPVEAQRLAEAFPVAGSSLEVFDTHFGATSYLGGADTTVEFSIDAQGRIAGFDRVYRGAYPLTATVW